MPSNYTGYTLKRYNHKISRELNKDILFKLFCFLEMVLQTIYSRHVISIQLRK